MNISPKLVTKILAERLQTTILRASLQKLVWFHKVQNNTGLLALDV
jgi:hypothetical protein